MEGGEGSNVSSLLHAKKLLCFHQVLPAPHLHTKVNQTSRNKNNCICLDVLCYLGIGICYQPEQKFESDFEILVLKFRSYIMPSRYLMVDRGREARTSLALYRALCHWSRLSR